MALFNRIEIDVPAAWDDRSEMELVEKDPPGGLPASIVLKRPTFDTDIQPADFKDRMEYGILAGVDGSEIVLSELRQVDGADAHYLHYRWSGNTGAFHRVQLALLDGERSLLLVCTGPEASFTENGPLFERAVQSLRRRA